MMDTALLARLERPTGMVDAVLDTDTYNEIDDQFALSYMIRSTDRIRVKGLYAAPFHNTRSEGPADGMEKSYNEILKLLRLAKREDLNSIVYRGSDRYLPSETEAVESPAARALIAEAMLHTPEKPLYVVTIGAITNVASAILLEPAICDRVVVVWLGGNSFEWPIAREFNMSQDIAAARVVFGCGAAVVQLPCQGVVSSFISTEPELRAIFSGKNELCDYLVENTCEYMGNRPNWSKVIWDVTAVGWLLDESFMEDRIVPAPIPQYDHYYSHDPRRHPCKYVWHINRDKLLTDLAAKLTKEEKTVYTIRRTDDISKMEEGRIALTPWGDEGYKPDARFYIGWGDDRFTVKLRAYEENPVADVTERNGNVCCDSCLEFFFSPSPDNSNGYFNFETNSNPTLLLHYGLGNTYPGRECVDWPLEAFDLKTTYGKDESGAYWQVEYIVPFDMLRKYIPGLELKAGDVIRANLYKCGRTRQVYHHQTWNNFDITAVPRANFHKPDYFGEMVLGE